MTPLTAISCQELVELVTEYLEKALSVADQLRVEQHLASCPACQGYVGQVHFLAGNLASLAEPSVPTETRERLLQVFRDFQQMKKAPEQRSIPLGIRGQYVARSEHLAYFWESDQDFEEAVGFLETGLEGDDHCFVFGHDQANQKVVAVLRQKGFDVDHLIAEGRVSVVGGNASGEALLANLGRLFQAALDAGSPLIRLLGNLGWGRENWPSTQEILEFEAKVTGAAQQFPCVVVCMYDVRSLPGRILLKGGFETHPWTMRRQVLCENPHYVPAEQFLAQLSSEAGPAKVQ